MNHLILVGGMVGAKSLTNFKFDPARDHSGCAICGEVFQSDLDRITEPTPEDLINAAALRAVWRINHAKTHSDSEHRSLAASGLWCTPEAAHKLAPFGVIPLSDALVSEATTHALATAPRRPDDDCTGS